MIAKTIWAICCPCLGVAFLVGGFTDGFAQPLHLTSSAQISLFMRNFAFTAGHRPTTEGIEKPTDVAPITLSSTGGMQV